CQQYKNFPDTF
nr:immunoglobulin light chain junction region [Macaca mulatta]